MSLLGEAAGEQPRQLRLVFDDQDPHPLIIGRVA
jgi:hypothetical protein